MNKLFLSLLVSLFISASANAEKPEWAGKGKPTTEQKEAHTAAMEAKIDNDNPEDHEDKNVKDDKKNKHDKKDKKNKTDKIKGLDKQKDKKLESTQKELDKGSEQGKESRQQRKKWWKFWDE